MGSYQPQKVNGSADVRNSSSHIVTDAIPILTQSPNGEQINLIRGVADSMINALRSDSKKQVLPRAATQPRWQHCTSIYRHVIQRLSIPNWQSDQP